MCLPAATYSSLSVLRSGDHFKNLMARLGGILQAYQANPTQVSPVAKEAALLVLGTLNHKLKKTPSYVADDTQ